MPDSIYALKIIIKLRSFTQKGDSKVTEYYSSSVENNSGQYAAGVDLQAVYAITNQCVVAVEYFNRREKNLIGR